MARIWATKSRNEQKIDAVEMDWCCKKTKLDHVPNKTIRKMMKVEIGKKKLNW